MSNVPNDKPSHADWSRMLANVNWFKEAIDYLEKEDCASGDLVAEARNKIAEAVELIAAAAENNDKDKQDKAKGLINEIEQTFFAMLDYCYNKYAGPRMRQMSKSSG